MKKNLPATKQDSKVILLSNKYLYEKSLLIIIKLYLGKEQ